MIQTTILLISEAACCMQAAALRVQSRQSQHLAEWHTGRRSNVESRATSKDRKVKSSGSVPDIECFTSRSGVCEITSS